MPDSRTASQDEVIAFLGEPSSYSPAPEKVERIDTHGALVFLAGERAYKIKRAVKLPYLDFSTLEKRRRACEREVEINRLTAPAIYLGVIPVTRGADGALVLGGGGETVEWVVEMVRFAQEAVLDRMATEGRLPVALMTPLAEHIAAYHAKAPVARDDDGVSGLTRVAEGVTKALSGSGDTPDAESAGDYADALKEALADTEGLLRERAGRGLVRRCHGDLHLRNIVMLDGAPVLFDAIEFDEAIATIDVLYDLAFLLMDLWRRDDWAHANAVLNRYLWRPDVTATIAGLAALPLFLSLRSAIRAMVTLDRLPHVAGAKRRDTETEARAYFALARGFLASPAPRLTAVGGLSGTGKSTLAAALAPSIGAAPGAFHLRSDVERKLLFGASPEETLEESAYGEEVTERVYATLNEKAALALSAGHSVILDAVFAREDQRAAAERTAAAAGVPFSGLWLTAPEDEMIERVEQRSGDASDADAEIVRQQLRRDPGAITWRTLDAGGAPDAVRDDAARRLGVTAVRSGGD